MVKQQLPRVNTNILGIGELKWTEIVNLMQMTIISTVGKNPIESEMQYLGTTSKMAEWSWFVSKASHSTSQ